MFANTAREQDVAGTARARVSTPTRALDDQPGTNPAVSASVPECASTAGGGGGGENYLGSSASLQGTAMPSRINA